MPVPVPCAVRRCRVGPQPKLPLLKTELTFWEFNAEDFSVAAKHAYSLSGFAFLHDVVATENYLVLAQNPVTGVCGGGWVWYGGVCGCDGMSAQVLVAREAGHCS